MMTLPLNNQKFTQLFVTPFYIYNSLTLIKHIAIVGAQLFVLGFIALALVFILEGRGDAGYLLHNLAASIDDGLEVVFDIVEEGGVVVANLFNHEIEGGKGIFDVKALAEHVGVGLTEEHLDVLGLCCHLLGGFHLMEEGVDKGMTLMEIALVEGGTVLGVTVFVYFLETLGVDIGDGHSHAADIHHQSAVTGNADDIALKAGIVARDDAQQGAVLGVIDKRTEEEAQSVGLGLRDAHEGLHLVAGDGSHAASAAVLAQFVHGQTLVEIGLELAGRTLEENQSAHRGCLDLTHTAMVAATGQIFDSLVNEMGDAVLLELLFDGFDLAVVNKEVAPRRASRVCRIFLATRAKGCRFHFGAFLHCWARWCFWLRKVGALWKRGAFKWLKALGFVGCRWRTRAILLHKLSSTLCLLGWSSSPGMIVPNLLRHCS